MWAKRRTIGSLCGRSEVEYTLNGTRTVSLARGMDPRHPTDMHVTGCRASRGCAPASWGGIIHHMSSAFACTLSTVHSYPSAHVCAASESQPYELHVRRHWVVQLAPPNPNPNPNPHPNPNPNPNLISGQSNANPNPNPNPHPNPNPNPNPNPSCQFHRVTDKGVACGWHGRQG